MTTDPRVLGLDIGGANIKLASDDGSYVQTKPFPMWTRHQELATVVEGMIGEYIARCKIQARLCSYRRDCGHDDRRARTVFRRSNPE